MNEILGSNKWEKMINGAPYGEKGLLKLTVNAELVKRESNSYPYYSITGEIAKTDKRFRDPIVTCGAIHDEILKHFPELAPLVTVHLSEADGQPMHAEANARYWAGFSTYPDGSQMGEYKPKMLAQHLQADRKTADEVRKGFEMGLPWYQIVFTLKLTELWNSQAGKARALLVDRSKVSA
jgi:hypothetical protein